MCTRDRVNNAGIIRTGYKVTLAVIYLRRDRVVGVAPAVEIPWLRGGRAPQVSAVATPPAPAAQNSARASGGLAGGRRVGACLSDGAHCRLHYPCTAAEPFFEPPRPHISFADILACNKFFTDVSCSE